MVARQYKPFTHHFGNIPLIVYPVKDENPLKEVFDSKNSISIQLHVNKLYEKNRDKLSKGNYHILFVWNLDKHRMTDVWIFDMKNWSDSGPLVECIIFRDLEVSSDAGIASGDSLIVLGREEELRRKVGNLEEYIDRSRRVPKFPSGMQPTEDFYK